MLNLKYPIEHYETLQFKGNFLTIIQINTTQLMQY